MAFTNLYIPYPWAGCQAIGIARFSNFVKAVTNPRRMFSGRGKIQPAGKMLHIAAGLVGARPMAGQLTLDQSIEVRILCPQLENTPICGVFSFKSGVFAYAARFSNP